MDIGRSDVRRRYLRKHIMRKFDARRLEPGLVERKLLRRSLRSFVQKTGFLELQAAAWINRPGSGEPTSVGQANITALVIPSTWFCRRDRKTMAVIAGAHHLARGVPIGRWMEITPPR